MANRFWGEAPIAQYTPSSMQEIMFGPQQMRAQEDKLTAEMDALNEANLSLQGVLGSAAGKQEEFSSAYNDILNRISKEGATRRNLDDARRVKSLYAQNVLPMQDFAKKREALALEYAKSKMDGDNIVVGSNPLSKTFDEWKADPNSLNSFQSVSRDKLNALGRAYGDNYAKGVTGRDSTDLDLGIMNFVKGFKNSNEAYAAYQSDPQFRTLVETQVNQVAKARGLDPSNAEVRDAISGGIMSGVVGGMDRVGVSSAVMKQKMAGEGGGDQRISSSFIDIQDNPNLNISEGDDLLALAKESPEMLKELNRKAKELTNGAYDFEQMEAKINAQDQKWRKYAPDILDKTGIADPEELRMKRDQLKGMLAGHPYFSRTQTLTLNKGEIANLGKTNSEDVLYRIRQTLDTPLKNALVTGALIDRAYSKEDRDLLEMISKQEVNLPENFAEVESLGFQGFGQPITDANGMLVGRNVSGPGKPVLSFTIRYKDDQKKDVFKVVNVRPTNDLYNSAKAVLGVLYDPATSSERDRMALQNMEQLDKNYRSSKVNQGLQ